MTKFFSFIILLIYLICSCNNTTHDNKITHESKIIKSEALHFFNKKQYNYVETKLGLPFEIMDIISRINRHPIKMGDRSDKDQINFSDIHMINKHGKDEYKYTSELHFALLGDTTCLIVYTKGGIGTHGVIDYIKYKGEFKHVRYVTAPFLRDTINLRDFLRNNPSPENIIY